MRVFFVMIFIIWTNCVFAQKQIIDSNAYASWPTLDGLRLSGDGKYVIYEIKKVPLGSETVVLQSTDGKFKREYVGSMKGAWFSSDGKSVFFHKSSDSLGILNLEKNRIRYIPHTGAFSLQEYGGHQWLCYFLVAEPHKLLLKDLKTNKDKYFNDVIKWQFSKDDKSLILWKQNPDDPKQQLLNWVNMESGKISKIWEGDKVENLILDEKYEQLIFEVSGAVWHYKLSSGVVVCVRKASSITQSGLILAGIDRFSKDGKSIFVNLKESHKNKPVQQGAVEVWNYRDVFLQTEQQEKAKVEAQYIASLNLETGKLIQLQQQYDSGLIFPSEGADTLALISNQQNNEGGWNLFNNKTWSFISTKTGERKKIDLFDQNGTVSLSPSGKHVFYYSVPDRGYFSYEISTGIVRCLIKDLDLSLWKDLYRSDAYKPTPKGIVSWLENDQGVLLYDSYDIWKLDLLNKQAPVNITNGYGRKHHIVFSLMIENDKPFKNDARLYLTAFNKENKNNGFFLKQLNNNGDPDLLSMEPYIFKTNSGMYVPRGSDFTPYKAKNAQMFMVRRMSATQAPNYFSTTDFKSYNKLSDLHPEKKYKWYTTELHTWKSLDGKDLQGILYKPENFDPSKKYPVIFNYYERASDGLNAYITPEPLCAGCQIDIPTYVSNGYLVFTPDIYYKIGDPMQGTYDAVVSAGKYLSGLSFVDGKKMGIQGCSFGGFQTDYLVTHTDLFAAACSSSGISNLVSGYGSLNAEGSSQQIFHEGGQLRMGASLWDKPDAYIKNSPIFSVDKVTTPVLIMHTTNDEVCLYPDALQFFTGLRRMGKKAWMLTYPNENHGLWLKKNVDDFTLRMMQFFDHYLKDKPAPVWMTNGISASRRGLDNGYEYDTEIKTPGPGLLSEAEQAKVDSLTSRKSITIMLR